jgi:hypothetical protein
MCILCQFSHTLNKNYCLQHVSCLAKDRTRTVPDLPLCLGVLKHRAPLAWGGHLPAKTYFLRWIFAYVVQF